jgi:hypothetical protein
MKAIILLLLSFNLFAQFSSVATEVNEIILAPGSICKECIKLDSGLNCDSFTVQHGCFHYPSKLKHKNKLVLYIRGLYRGMSKVPANKRAASINDLETTYGLHSLSEKEGLPIYLTSSHRTSFGAKQINKLIKTLNLESPVELIIVSHSGGHRGLYKTLKNLNSSAALVSVSRIVMLDNFYMNPEWIDEFQTTMGLGSKCSGFLTTHNENRYKGRFKDKVACDVEGPKGFDHYKDVNNCFMKYINGKSCK